MAKLKGKQLEERERLIQLAISHYQGSSKPDMSMRASAEAYGIPWTTLRDRLKGAEPRRAAHKSQQILSDYEEGTIVRWCERMDDWGFPLRLSLVKEMAAYLVRKREIGRTLGKHWLERFLKRNPNIKSRFASRLDRQRALTNNAELIKDYYKQVQFHFTSGILEC